MSICLIRVINKINDPYQQYQNVDDEEWESEMKAKKQLKNIQQTTFKTKNESKSSGISVWVLTFFVQKGNFENFCKILLLTAMLL